MSDPFTVSGSSESQDFQPLEGGVHRGQLAALVHQPDTPGYQGGDPTDQIIAVFVTPDVLDSQGEPRQVRKFLNLPNNPMHEKAGLRRFIEQWIGKKLSDAQIAKLPLKKFLAKRATLVTQIATSASDREYAKLTAISPPMKDHKEVDLAGVTVRVSRWPKQVWVTAPGVDIEEVGDAPPPAREDPPPPAEDNSPSMDDIPF